MVGDRQWASPAVLCCHASHGHTSKATHICERTSTAVALFVSVVVDEWRPRANELLQPHVVVWEFLQELVAKVPISVVTVRGPQRLPAFVREACAVVHASASSKEL